MKPDQMKALFIFIALIGTSTGLQASCGALNPTLTVIDNGTGNYMFELTYETDQGYTLTNIAWDFGDMTGTINNTSQSMPHQYYYTTPTTYNVSATCNFNNGSIIQCVVSTHVTTPSELPAVSCPVSAFVPLKSSDWCHTGDLTIHWGFCNEDYNGDGADDNYWTADHVVWNMGDGTSLTTTGTNPATHTYTSSVTQTISATAYFSGQNGEICSSPLMLINGGVGGNGDPCMLVNDPTLLATPYVSVDPYLASAEIYMNPAVACQREPFQIFNNPQITPVPANYNSWSYELFMDGTSVASGAGMPDNSSWIHQSSLDPGDYTFEIVYTYNNPAGGSCSAGASMLYTVDSCEVACDNCNSFKPYAGERYWLSAWVKEDQASQVLKYNGAHINLDFTGSGVNVDFYPEGEIIDGWQRIVGSFTVPGNTTELDIKLVNGNASIDAFFDDIRIHPFNASMKSYVYDPETFWLTAELDDNNYATFYEYDKEGQLIRIKKETARGIMTIQESRSSNPKSE